MIDNSKKIHELESKMDMLEQTLNEIKAAIKDRKAEEMVKEDNDESIDSSELSTTEKKKIRDIMERFDFEKVHGIMKSLDWKWAFSKEGTPTVEELKSEAYRLLAMACEEKTNVSTGGLRAVYENEYEGPWGEEDDDPYIALEFVAEECEGFDEEDEQ